MPKGKVSSISDESIVNYIRRFGPLSNAQLSAQFGITPAAMCNRVSKVPSHLLSYRVVGSTRWWKYVEQGEDNDSTVRGQAVQAVR